MMQKIGTILVDAGIIMIGDPCYTLPDGAGCRNDLAKDWVKFCRATEADEIAQPFGKGTAIVLPSGAGDGEYPVYVERERDGTIKSVTVDFSGEAEE